MKKPIINRNMLPKMREIFDVLQFSAVKESEQLLDVQFS
jgi:hypothetical protein